MSRRTELVSWLSDRDPSARVHLVPHRTAAPFDLTAQELLDLLAPVAVVTDVTHHHDETGDRWARPPTPAECIEHLRAGGVVEEQAKGWRRSGRGGLWEEAFFTIADYEEWNLPDEPRGFLRLVPIPEPETYVSPNPESPKGHGVDGFFS